MKYAPAPALDWVEFTPRQCFRMELIFWRSMNGECQDSLINRGVVFG